MTQPTVLMIDDEEEIANGIELNFQREGLKVFKAFTGEAGLEAFREERPDLVILDLMFPNGTTGFDICRSIRKQDEETPIVILSAKAEEIDRVVGFELGADDFVTKPFSVRELLARVRRHLKRSTSNGNRETAAFEFGSVVIDFEKFVITKNANPLTLTAKEFQLLRYFVENQGKVLSRDKLLDEVWGYDRFITTRTVDNHILHLRKKIEDNPSNPSYILSVWGEGYKFVA